MPMRMEYAPEARRLLLLAKKHAWEEGERIVVTADDIIVVAQLEQSRPRVPRCADSRKRGSSYLN